MCRLDVEALSCVVLPPTRSPGDNPPPTDELFSHDMLFQTLLICQTHLSKRRQVGERVSVRVIYIQSFQRTRQLCDKRLLLILSGDNLNGETRFLLR